MRSHCSDSGEGSHCSSGFSYLFYSCLLQLSDGSKGIKLPKDRQLVPRIVDMVLMHLFVLGATSLLPPTTRAASGRDYSSLLPIFFLAVPRYISLSPRKSWALICRELVGVIKTLTCLELLHLRLLPQIRKEA